MILERLKSMEGFTHQEQAVAQYILRQMEDIQGMSSDELARRPTPARLRWFGSARSWG